MLSNLKEHLNHSNLELIRKLKKEENVPVLFIYKHFSRIFFKPETTCDSLTQLNYMNGELVESVMVQRRVHSCTYYFLSISLRNSIILHFFYN